MDGQQERIATGFPSLAAPDGSGAAGPHDISIRGGDVYVIVGLGADPAILDDGTLPDPAGDFGKLVRLLDDGAWEIVADVAGYETTANPDGGALDSNPYAVLGGADGFVVADAGGNDLLGVDADNVVSTVAVFPDVMVDAPVFLGLDAGAKIPMQSVPTTVTMGSDGAYYVGLLTGFPFPAGAASIYKVVAGQEPEVFAEGFTNVSDIAFDDDGNLWVLEIAANSLLAEAPAGGLTRVNADGTRDVVVSEGLVMPTGVAIGPDGNVYITNCGVCPGGGAVLRMTEVEPVAVPPATGDYTLTPMMGAMVGVFGLTLVFGGALMIRRRFITP